MSWYRRRNLLFFIHYFFTLGLVCLVSQVGTVIFLDLLVYLLPHSPPPGADVVVVCGDAYGAAIMMERAIAGNIPLGLSTVYGIGLASESKNSPLVSSRLHKTCLCWG
jgi:hypothetical protein